MRHDAWRQDLAAYTERFDIEPRWADVDTLRHLNNSALHGLHQEARVRFLAARIGHGFWRDRNRDAVLESHDCDEQSRRHRSVGRQFKRVVRPGGQLLDVGRRQHRHALHHNPVLVPTREVREIHRIVRV